MVTISEQPLNTGASHRQGPAPSNSAGYAVLGDKLGAKLPGSMQGSLLGQRVKLSLGALLQALLGWQSAQVAQLRLSELSSATLKDVGLFRDNQGHLVRRPD